MLLLLLSFTLLSTASGTEEDLLVKKALKSTKVFTGLLNSYLQNFHKHYSKKELKGRTRVFSKSLKKVDDCNENEHFHCKLNQFSSMTESEKTRYLGLGNLTGIPVQAQRQPTRLKKRYVSSKDWRDFSAVSPVKNQGACGACWAFAAAVAVEGTYAITTGKLKSFSDQELLECTYEAYDYDGCGGGWYFDAFDFLQKHQHLSTASTLHYTGQDGSCRKSGANGLLAAEVTGFVKTNEDDYSLAAAIEISPVAIAMLATGDFFSYSDGAYDGYYDCSGATYPNHAMAAVAFTQDAFVVKNSWGPDWGENGYVSISRWRNVCFINDHGYYPTMVKTGEDNSADDIVTPTSAPDGECKEQQYDDDCVDFNSRDCPGIKSAGTCYKDYMMSYTTEYCQKSCGFCNNIPLQDLATDCVQRISDSTCSDEDTKLVCPRSCCENTDDGGDNNGCPSGTTLCPDGTCKHIHMC